MPLRAFGGAGSFGHGGAAAFQTAGALQLDCTTDFLVANRIAEELSGERGALVLSRHRAAILCTAVAGCLSATERGFVIAASVFMEDAASGDAAMSSGSCAAAVCTTCAAYSAGAFCFEIRAIAASAEDSAELDAVCLATDGTGATSAAGAAFRVSTCNIRAGLAFTEGSAAGGRGRDAALLVLAARTFWEVVVTIVTNIAGVCTPASSVEVTRRTRRVFTTSARQTAAADDSTARAVECGAFLAFDKGAVAAIDIVTGADFIEAAGPSRRAT